MVPFDSTYKFILCLTIRVLNSERGRITTDHDEERLEAEGSVWTYTVSVYYRPMRAAFCICDPSINCRRPSKPSKGTLTKCGQSLRHRLHRYLGSRQPSLSRGAMTSRNNIEGTARLMPCHLTATSKGCPFDCMWPFFKYLYKYVFAALIKTPRLKLFLYHRSGLFRVLGQDTLAFWKTSVGTF